MAERITIKVPGKLMVAGEFAVLEPKQKLLVMAVDRFVYTTIEKQAENELTLANYDLNHLQWHYHQGIVTVNSEDPRINYVKKAMELTLTYLHELNIDTSPFSLHIKSELNDESGVKYGLGSSAAVVTSVVSAILTAFLQEAPSRLTIFKLAAMTHVSIQGNGSGADIAASTYGGLLLYTSFQAEWLFRELQNTPSIRQLVDKDWIYLSITRTSYPNNLNVYVGWTGSPASTGNLVSRIRELKRTSPQKYESFIENSNQAVQKLMDGIYHDDVVTFFEGINDNRAALTALGKDACVPIDTDKLNKLSDEAIALGGAGKFSGAGGGDCGLAFMPTHVNQHVLFERWERQQIKPLNLTVYSNGAQNINE